MTAQPPATGGRQVAIAGGDSPIATVRTLPDAALITSLGWSACSRVYTWSACVEAARAAAGAPYSAAVPLTSDGVWMVPQLVHYGDYRAAVGPDGSCFWYGYDARGRQVDSGVFVRSGSVATATVTPTMTTFQTYGCTPWFRVQPLN